MGNRRRSVWTGWWLVYGVLGSVLVAPACRRAPAPPPAFQVALVATSTSPLAAAATAGLAEVGKRLGAVTTLRVGADEAGQRQALRALGEHGVDLVFCIGDDVADLVYSEAAAAPDTDFVVLDGLLHGRNLAGAVFRAQEGGFLAGVLAAHAGADAPPGVLLAGGAGAWDEALIRGFLEGFHSVAPGAEPDRAQGTEAVAELATAGVKVALAPSGMPDSEDLVRCREHGVFLVPALAQRPAELPDGVAAAVVVDVPEAMLRVAREVRDGSFRGGTYGFDLGSGVVDLVVDPDWPGAADPTLEKALDDARAGITAGIVEVEHLGIGMGS